MREIRRQRRDRPGTVKVQLQEAERSGRLVIEAKGVCQRFGEKTILNDFSTLIMRGDRVGIVGPNGSGKTTLLRILLGELEPSAGTVRRGIDLEPVYFDQLHAQLDDEKSVQENVAGGSDAVVMQRSAAAHHRLPGGLPSRPSRPAVPWPGSPAASGTACSWPGCSPGRRTGWCWTSRPTTWTSRRWSSGRSALGILRHAVVGEPRPRVSQPGGHQHAGPGGGRRGPRICRRLRRLAAPAV